MKSVKQDNQAFQVYSSLNHLNEKFFDTFFSNDLVDVLKGDKSLLIKRNSDGFTSFVELDDVVYDETYTAGMNNLKYGFYFKVPFGGNSTFSILLSNIENDYSVQPPDSIYWLYSDDSANPDYKFTFKQNSTI